VALALNGAKETSRIPDAGSSPDFYQETPHNGEEFGDILLDTSNTTKSQLDTITGVACACIESFSREDLPKVFQSLEICVQNFDSIVLAQIMSKISAVYTSRDY